MKLTQQEQADIVRRSALAWSHFREGEDAEGILSRLYCENLPDKSPAQGRMMAEELLRWMARFQDCYDAALESPEEYTRYLLNQELEVLSLDQQCLALEQILQAVDPGRSGSPEEAPSNVRREALLAEAAATLADGGAYDVLEQVFPAEAGDAGNRRRVKAIGGETMVMAVNAMIVYTMVKRGELSGIPETGSLAQVVAGVCTEEQFRTVCREEQAGLLPQEAVQTRKRALAATWRTMAVLTGAAAAGGFAVLAAGPLLGTLLLSAPALAVLGMVLVEKYRMDRKMIEDERDTLVSIPVNLPVSDKVWQPGQSSRTEKETEFETDSLGQTAVQQQTTKQKLF